MVCRSTLIPSHEKKETIIAQSMRFESLIGLQKSLYILVEKYLLVLYPQHFINQGILYVQSEKIR